MTLIGAQRLIEPDHYDLRDMTPVQLARRYGPTVADYIIELREYEDTWKRLFCQARDGESDNHRVPHE